MPVWPGDPEPQFVEQISGSILVTSLTVGLHCGTHVDAPRHFINDGKCLDAYPLERFIGRVRVVSVCGSAAISLQDIMALDLAGIDKVLFKTRNSSLWQHTAFQQDFVGLEAEAARYLVAGGISLVGIDYLSIQAFGADNDVHTILLSNDILILEGLNLSAVSDGDYLLSCLPLALANVEASPVRAVLLPLQGLEGI